MRSLANDSKSCNTTGSLADLLITCNLVGYYDPRLRDAVDGAARSATSQTQWLSARQNFPDAFYELNQSGRMEWLVIRDMLSIGGEVGALRNLAVMLTPTARRPHFGRLMCTYLVDFVIELGPLQVRIESEISQVTFIPDRLTLESRVELSPGASVLWDFGDGSGFQAGATDGWVSPVLMVLPHLPCLLHRM